MRKMIFTLLLLPFFSFAQDPELQKIFPMKDGNIYYEKVFDVEAASKEQLLKRAKAWLIKHQPVRDAAMLDDQESGMTSSNIHFSNLFAMDVPMQKDSLKTEWHYWYNVRVYVKDNKAKIVADNLRFSGIANTNLFKVEDYKEQVESLYKAFPGAKRAKQKYYASVYKSFGDANTRVLNDLASLEEAMKGKIKSESDF